MVGQLYAALDNLLPVLGRNIPQGLHKRLQTHLKLL